MRRLMGFAGTLAVLALVTGVTGCDKERTVTSTEIVHDTKYIELPGDTVYLIDTVSGIDTMIIHDIDTVNRTDTVHVNIVVHDTVTKIVNHYDTVTVTVTNFAPTATTAVAAMQALTDPQVFQFAYDNFGMSDGWVLYLSPLQMEVTQSSAKVWDVAAYVDYWTADWSGYYPLEVYWRMTYKSGDPTNPANWTMGDPPAAVSGQPAGVSSSTTLPLNLMATPAPRDATKIR